MSSGFEEFLSVKVSQLLAFSVSISFSIIVILNNKCVSCVCNAAACMMFICTVAANMIF